MSLKVSSQSPIIKRWATDISHHIEQLLADGKLPSEIEDYPRKIKTFLDNEPVTEENLVTLLDTLNALESKKVIKYSYTHSHDQNIDIVTIETDGDIVSFCPYYFVRVLDMSKFKAWVADTFSIIEPLKKPDYSHLQGRVITVKEKSILFDGTPIKMSDCDARRFFLAILELAKDENQPININDVFSKVEHVIKLTADVKLRRKKLSEAIQKTIVSTLNEEVQKSYADTGRRITIGLELKSKSDTITIYNPKI